MAHQEIDQGEDYLMRSCDVSNYVNLRWHVSKFETLRSGEVSLSAQFDDHGDYKYFSIDGKTSDYDAFVFTVCLAYGSREEMIDAIRSIAEEHADGSLPLESIDEQAVSDRLYTGDMPDPDLVIRTSGEERISNFLLWQMAYSELYFTDVFWPSFQKKDLLKAVRTFQDRRRRFGE